MVLDTQAGENTQDWEAITTVSAAHTSFSLRGASKKDHIFQQIDRTGKFYEHELLQRTQRLLRPGDLVVDVGANIGNHSVFWGGVCQAVVLAIEPAPSLHEILRTNVIANDLESNVFCRSYALGEAKGQGRIEPGAEVNAGETRIAVDNSGDILIRPLEEVPEVKGQEVRLLKVDVEGMELPVLKGASHVIRECHPVIVCECSDYASYNAVDDFLGLYGYVMMECFNATPTYVFVVPGWDYPSEYSHSSHVRDVIARNSRMINELVTEVNHLKRRLAKTSTPVPRSTSS